MADHTELHPPPSKSLKRSASVASLPTPPRTVRKRSRSRGSAYHSSDDEVDDALPVVSPHASPSQSHHMSDELGVAPHKRRRIDAVVAELNAEDGEDAFWFDGTAVGLKAPKQASKPSRVPRSVSKGKPPSSSRRGPPISTRRLSQSRAVPASSAPATWSLLSPPPTRPRRLVTPPRKRPAKPMPVRDSPNNPFLVNSSNSPGSVPSSPVGPRTPIPNKETIHYVLYVVLPLLLTLSYPDHSLFLAAASVWPSKTLILAFRKIRARRSSPNIRTFPRRKTVPPAAFLALRTKASPRPKRSPRRRPHQSVHHRQHGRMMATMTMLSAHHLAQLWHGSLRKSAEPRERSYFHLRMKGRPVPRPSQWSRKARK